MKQSWAVCAVIALVIGCGDNLKGPGQGSDGGAGEIDGGAGAVCGDGIVGPGESCDEDSPCCANCQLVPFDTVCRASTGECDATEVCDGLGPTCPVDDTVADGTPCSIGFCTGGACEECDPDIDADFDGFDQCVDCNDLNGLVNPDRAETCDGIDEDCDAAIDETFDIDGDSYSICSDDPLLTDCDDTDENVNPGATESCGDDGEGNDVDENCNGFIDELCEPCDPADDDGDGLSECQGDCDDTRDSVSPNLPEACDGRDTDCNRFTVQNCTVSDPCNFASGTDECLDNMECGCVLNEAGSCTGDYRCASFCQGSYTGPIGAGCGATQTCAYRWTASDNQHACFETTAALGSLLGGAPCDSDAECRSGACETYCTGQGCQQARCVDFCDHHDVGAAGSCADGAICEIAAITFMGAAMFAHCRLDNNGPGETGDSCAGGCRFGPASCVDGACAEPCGQDSHCPSGYHCSLRGNQIVVGTWDGSVPVVGGQPAIETVPVCLANSGSGAHDRPAGAVCGQNSDCTSEMCDVNLGVCVSTCVTDAACPPGLTCQPTFIRTPPGDGSGIVWGRVCLGVSPAGPIEAM